MKKITFLFLLTVGFYQLAFSQCTTNATAFGNNTSVTMYNVQGTVEVILNTNNTVTVNLLSNFSTAAGPDVRVFLVDRGTLTNTQLKVSSNFLTRPRIEMGLSPVSGASTYTKAIPASMNISEFDTVYFYCQAFSQFWDFGSFSPFTSITCSALTTNDFENEKLNLVPNPASDELNITLDTLATNYKVSIYNAVGSLVFNRQLSNSDSKIDLSNIHSGVYIVQITDEENKIYQKRLIKN